MFRKQSDLLLGIMLALILLGLVIFGVHLPILQVILALPFILIVPGNAIIKAILPGSNPKWLEKFLFAIGLSLAVVMLSGLVLYITPWGLQAASWTVILSAITLVASGIAIWRQQQIPVKESNPWRIYLPFRQILLLGLAIVSVGFAVKLAFTPRSPQNIQGYTSLWILPGPQNQPNTLLIGINSQEFETVHYDLRLTFNGQLYQEWSDISLAPNTQWQQTVSMPTGKGQVEAILYRVDSPGVVYRRVSVTLNE
jgi:uncharacterized membrane protein